MIDTLGMEELTMLKKVKTILLSGGLDSTCAAYDLMDNLEEDSSTLVRAVWIDYGQQNSVKELKSVQYTCSQLKLPLQIIRAEGIFSDVDSTVLHNNGSTQIDVWNAEVPHRNSILTLIASANSPYQPEVEETFIVAAHKTSAPYADVTKRFYTLLNQLLKYETGSKRVEAPYIQYTKYQLAKKGYNAGMTKTDFLKTASCYTAQGDCGKCPACLARQEVMKNIWGAL